MRVDPGTSFREKLLDPDESFGVIVPGVFSYENSADLREAVENFRAYLAILLEWDRKERLEAEHPLGRKQREPGVDWESG